MIKLINHNERQSTAMNGLLASLIKNRQLIYRMTKQEIIGRYRGSVIGLAWSLFNPILLLTIYTFVFSVVFKSRWMINGSESKAEFALILFMGMIVYGLFSETINRAPSLIVNNTNYVKKIVFPLELLPIISFGVVFFHALISFIVLLCACILFNGFIPWTAVLIPIIVLPLVFLTLGISWFLGSLGVFVRDTNQSVNMLTTFLLFLSPVFYPIAMVPENLQIFILLNPVSFIIEQARVVLIFGLLPNWLGLFFYSIVSIVVMIFGYKWFQKTRKGFADVL